jgi:transcription termination/antitermination protein NusG
LERKGGSLSSTGTPRVNGLFCPRLNANFVQMNSMESWFAIRVRSRCEKLAAVDLETKGFEVCAATAPHRRVWVDRVRTVEMPLFPGYIFGRFQPIDRSKIQRGAGVAGIVGSGGFDYPVAEAEMDSVLALVRSGVEVFQTPFFQVGARVKVCAGPLAGIVGVLQQVKNGHRLVISVEFLQRSVAVELDLAMVQPIPLSPHRVVNVAAAATGRMA